MSRHQEAGVTNATAIAIAYTAELNGWPRIKAIDRWPSE